MLRIMIGILIICILLYLAILLPIVLAGLFILGLVLICRKAYRSYRARKTYKMDIKKDNNRMNEEILNMTKKQTISAFMLRGKWMIREE